MTGYCFPWNYVNKTPLSTAQKQHEVTFRCGICTFRLFIIYNWIKYFMGLMYFKYKILNVEICWKTCICLVLEKKLVKRPAGGSSSLLNHWVIQTMLFKMAEYCRSESNYCFYEWFSESVIHPSQRFGFRFEHKRKHHIVAHRLDNHWEIAVICFAPATIVLMRVFRTRKRETSELSAHPHTRERETSEQPQILAAADRSDITI